MRPLRLEINGFTAFRDPQRVDFSELDLFTITGPTGAGKTSLLDAIALSLYGRVPRMGGQNLGQLVSHGKPEARILLEFSVNGDTYQVSRRLPRAGAQQGKLERREGDRWVDVVDRGGVKAINEAILGLVKLDFESFCKAIVLPQGDFAKFLKGEPKERRETLTTLLGLKVYDRMGKLARQRASELRIRGQNTREILDQQFADATREALVSAQANVAAAASHATTTAERLSAAREVDRSRAVAAERARAAGSLASRFEGIGNALDAEVDRCRGAEAAKADADAARERAIASVTAATDAHAAAQAQLEDVRARTGAREDLARLLDAVDRRGELERRVGKVQAALDEAGRRQAELTAAVVLNTKAQADSAAAAEKAGAAERQARQGLAACERTRDDLERRLAQAREATTAVAAAAGVLERATGAAADAARALDHAKSAHADAEAEREAVRRQHAAAALASGLAPGDPCPVCSRPLEEHPVVEADVEQRLAEVETAIGDAAGKAQHAGNAANRAHAAAETARARHADARERLTTALEGEALDALESQAADAAAAVAAAQAALSAASDTLAEAAAAAQAAAVEASRAHADLEAAEREHERAEQALQEAAGDRDAALALLRDHFGDDVPDDARTRLEQSVAELTGAEDQAGATRTALDGAREALKSADDAVREATAALTAIDLRLGELRATAQAALGELDRIDAETKIPNVPEPDAARDLRASTLSAWCGRTARSLRGLAAAEEARGAALVEQLLSLSVDAAPEDTASALSALEAAEREAVGARVRAEEAAANLADRVGQREDLEAGLAEDDQRIAVLSVLAKELRADHFIEFVLQETLDLLAGHASEELLRISDDRYSLVSQDGEFSVVDHVNADEQRSVKTLSGGETFMASLSLALALSKHVTELAGEGLGTRLEAVFIDEGFGSLDPETLEEVIDALERLREEDLLIGVISHVPALAERLTTGLRVQKDGNRSIVLASA